MYKSNNIQCDNFASNNTAVFCVVLTEIIEISSYPIFVCSKNRMCAMRMVK